MGVATRSRCDSQCPKLLKREALRRGTEPTSSAVDAVGAARVNADRLHQAAALEGTRHCKLPLVWY